MAAGGVGGADEFAAELLAAAGKVRTGNAAVIAEFGAAILAETRSRAPRETGDYRGSWRSVFGSDGPDEVVWSNFTEAAEGPRLEYGFHGRDSKGRVYDQAPRSHQRAAIDVVYRHIPAALQAMIQAAIRG